MENSIVGGERQRKVNVFEGTNGERIKEPKAETSAQGEEKERERFTATNLRG